MSSHTTSIYNIYTRDLVDRQTTLSITPISSTVDLLLYMDSLRPRMRLLFYQADKQAKGSSLEAFPAQQSPNASFRVVTSSSRHLVLKFLGRGYFVRPRKPLLLGHRPISPGHLVRHVPVVVDTSGIMQKLTKRPRYTCG